MRVVDEGLPPGMEYCDQTDPRSEMLRVGGGFEQGRSGGAEEQAVQQPLVAQDEGPKRLRQGEDDVEVRHRQELSPARREPAMGRVALARLREDAPEHPRGAERASGVWAGAPGAVGWRRTCGAVGAGRLAWVLLEINYRVKLRAVEADYADVLRRDLVVIK